jgi:hypothetical protein
MLADLLEELELRDILHEHGNSANDVSGHGVRKGSMSNVTTGTVSCPNIYAVLLRALHPLGGQNDSYIRWGAAGDCSVGRAASGNTTSPHNCLLPPHFDPTIIHGAVWKDIMKQLLPGAEAIVDTALSGVFKLALASVVYHCQHITDTFHSDNPVLQTALFRNPELMQTLSDALIVGYESPYMQATGLTDAMTTKLSMARLEAKQEVLLNFVQNDLQETIAVAVNGMLEERAMGNGTATAGSVHAIVGENMAAMMEHIKGMETRMMEGMAGGGGGGAGSFRTASSGRCRACGCALRSRCGTSETAQPARSRCAWY